MIKNFQSTQGRDKSRNCLKTPLRSNLFVNQGENFIYVSTPTDFNFQECLKFLGRSDQEILHRITGDKIRKLIKCSNDIFLLEVSNSKDKLIQIKCLNDQPDKSASSEIHNYVFEWFDLSTNMLPFYHMASQNPLLKNLVRSYCGLRLMKIPELFEALCWAIMGQHINLSFAYTLKKRFVESFGEKLEYQHEVFWLFPSPEIIAKIITKQLMQLQFTEKKAEYIVELAKLFASGNISKEHLLRNRDFDYAKKVLLKIRGIGPWTANYVLMRCLGDPSAIPVEDVGLHNAIQRQLHLTQKPTTSEILKLSAGWKNWQAYAAFYFYRSLL